MPSAAPIASRPALRCPNRRKQHQAHGPGRPQRTSSRRRHRVVLNSAHCGLRWPRPHWRARVRSPSPRPGQCAPLGLAVNRAPRTPGGRDLSRARAVSEPAAPALAAPCPSCRKGTASRAATRAAVLPARTEEEHLWTACYREGRSLASPDETAWLAWSWRTCPFATTPGRGWTPAITRPTGGCGPTSPASPSPGTWPRRPPCSPSRQPPPGAQPDHRHADPAPAQAPALQSRHLRSAGPQCDHARTRSEVNQPGSPTPCFFPRAVARCRAGFEQGFDIRLGPEWLDRHLPGPAALSGHIPRREPVTLHDPDPPLGATAAPSRSR
jgi:hypothetical protein